MGINNKLIRKKSEDEFKIRVKKILLGMDKRQVVYFMWLCAVRVLPFLSVAGSFDYWKEYDRRKHLYAVLRAIDCAAANAVAAANAAAYVSMPIRSIIEKDIQYIKSGEYDKLNNGISIYGEVWDNFQNALRGIGCEYWGKLYSEIFESHFQQDKEALKRRINVPIEIQEQGAEAVAKYLEQLEKEGGERLNEARIIILGDKGAGKTCLARRLKDIHAEMTQPSESTEGVETSIWTVSDENNEKVNIHIWDFAGHVVTHAAHRCFLSERCLYVIVYDGRTERRDSLEYWLQHAVQYGHGAKVRVLANLFDNHLPRIQENRLKRKYHPMLESFDYFSIENDYDKLEKFRESVASDICRNPMWSRQEIPASMFRVKNQLEKLFQRESTGFENEHITFEYFKKIVLDCGVESDGVQQTLVNLHHLGICLWYSSLEGFNLLILNPDWITNGVYRMINWAQNNGKHIVKITDYEDIYGLEKGRYPEDKLPFLFKLMQEYELAFPYGEGKGILIPSLLDNDEPERLPVFREDNSLMLQYVFEQPLPPNTVCRLMVRRYKELWNQHKDVWYYGGILHKGADTVALVYEEDRKVVIKVNGRNQKEYISELRETMDEIFESYKSIRPTLEYRIVGSSTIMSVQEMAGYQNITPEKLRQIKETCKMYNITNYNYGDRPQLTQTFGDNSPVSQTNGKNSPIHNENNTFNFRDCNIELQGELRSLSSQLKRDGQAELAEELESLAGDLEQAEQLSEPEEVKKKGALSRLKLFFEELGDEKSSKAKIIKGIKGGARLLQSLGKKYNQVAKWVAWPQIPDLFLGE